MMIVKINKINEELMSRGLDGECVLNIPVVRHSCICRNKFKVNTNKYIGDHEPLICEKCNGFILLNQMPKRFEGFKECFGTDS